MGRRRVRKGSQSESQTSNEDHEAEMAGQERFGAGDERVGAGERNGGFFACYLLHSLSPRYKGHTYIGFTINPRRRIRQHNGEIRSGAWRTKRKRPWEMVLCVYGFPTNVSALQFEWAWQHPRESLAVRKAAASFKSLAGVSNKIKLVYTMLTLPEWENLSLTVNFFSTKHMKDTARCPRLPENMTTTVCTMDDLPCYMESQMSDNDDDCYDDYDVFDGTRCDDMQECNETYSVSVKVNPHGSFLQSEPLDSHFQAKQRSQAHRQMKSGNIEEVQKFSTSSYHEFQNSASAVDIYDSSLAPASLGQPGCETEISFINSDKMPIGGGFPLDVPWSYDPSANSSDEGSGGDGFPAGDSSYNGGSKVSSDGFPVGSPSSCDRSSNLKDASTPQSVLLTIPSSNCAEPRRPEHDVIDLSTPPPGCNSPSCKKRLYTCPQFIDLTESPVIIHL